MTRRGAWLARLALAMLFFLPLAPGRPGAAAHPATPQAGATPEPGLIPAQVVTSPRYGLFLSIYAGWSVAGQRTGGDREEWRLVNGPTGAVITAAPAVGDAAACLAAAVEASAQQGTPLTLAQSLDPGHLPARDLASAAALYTATTTDAGGASLNEAFLIQCRPIPGANAMLRIEARTPVDTFQANSSAILLLLDGVVLPTTVGEAVPAMQTQHVQQGEPHLPYTTTPPTSGPHYGFTLAKWGVSAQPIQDEVVVHSLEHGGVALFFNCDCPAARAILEKLADPATGYPVKVLSAPYPDMPEEIVLVSWHYRLSLRASQVTEATVRAFIDAHIDHGFEYIATETATLAAWRAATPTP